ncbi:MAG: hypothetical protein QOG54_242 [Actinomycetota bacterium]|nr:hypothetical protein [Actinomycetota bacterium]
MRVWRSAPGSNLPLVELAHPAPDGRPRAGSAGGHASSSMILGVSLGEGCGVAAAGRDFESLEHAAQRPTKSNIAASL